MNQLLDQARTLRLSGKSYNEINKTLGVPKSTLSFWFSNLELNRAARRRLAGRIHQGVLRGLVERNRRQTTIAQYRAANIRKKSKTSIKSFDRYKLLLLGASLYWAEGYKRPVVRDGLERTHHVIGFTNSDPKMVKVFIGFLQKIMDVPRGKIGISLRLFDRKHEIKSLNFWKKITGLPQENFDRVSYVISKSSMGKRPYNRLPYGTVQVRVNNTEKFHQLMGWIEGIEEKAIQLPG